MKNSNSHVGSSLDDFLAEENLLVEANEMAIKRVIAWQLQ
jgi:antitoxin HicB